MKTLNRLLISVLALSMTGCATPLTLTSRTDAPKVGPVGALYDSRLRVTVGPPRGVQTLPLAWDRVRLTVSSPKLHVPLTREIVTTGAQVTAEFMVPPGEVTVMAELMLLGSGVAQGSATAALSPGATQGVEIAMFTSRTTVATLAGQGGYFYGDGKPGPEANFYLPEGMVVDDAGNLYVSDSSHHRIRRISTTAPHTVTTVVAAPIVSPRSLVLDGLGNLYFYEENTTAVRRLNLATGALDTVFTGQNIKAMAYRDGHLYLADIGYNRILKLNVTTSALSEFIGNSSTVPGFTYIPNAPHGLAFSPDGTALYVTEFAGHRVFKADLANNTITVVAGTGQPGMPTEGMLATAAAITNPTGVAVDTLGNVYITSRNGQKVFRITSAGQIFTVAGSGGQGFAGDGGQATDAMLNHPGALAIDPGGALFVLDESNHRIRRIFGGTITTYAGNGNRLFYGGDEQAGIPAADAAFSFVGRVAVDENGNVYVADGDNSRVRIIANATESRYGLNLQAGKVYTVAGNGEYGYPQFGGRGFESPLGNPRGLALDAAGNLYISDSSKNVVVKVEKASGQLSLLAGSGGSGHADGTGTAAMFSAPEGMAYSAVTGELYVADRLNNRIRAINVATTTVSTLAGTGVQGATADGDLATTSALNWPTDVALDAMGNLYFTDANNHKVRALCRVSGTYFGDGMIAGNLYTVAGTGTAGYPATEGVAATGSPLNSPQGLALDATGNVLIADTMNNRVRMVDRTSGVITPVIGFQSGSGIGLGALGSDFGTARLSRPGSVAVSTTGRIYVADTNNLAIRLALPPGL